METGKRKTSFAFAGSIIALAILAILTVVVAPYSFGWSDEPKARQYMLEARNICMATQMALNEKYAERTQMEGNSINTVQNNDMWEEIRQLSDSNVIGVSGIQLKEDGEDTHQIEKMNVMYFTSDGIEVGVTNADGQYYITSLDWESTKTEVSSASKGE